MQRRCGQEQMRHDSNLPRRGSSVQQAWRSRTKLQSWLLAACPEMSARLFVCACPPGWSSRPGRHLARHSAACVRTQRLDVAEGIPPVRLPVGSAVPSRPLRQHGAGPDRCQTISNQDSLPDSRLDRGRLDVNKPQSDGQPSLHRTTRTTSPRVLDPA